MKQDNQPKRKRGRPRKVNEELKKAAESVEFIALEEIPGALANYEPPDDIIVLKGRKGNLMIGVKPIFRESTPYPKEWATMGKIDRLAWLTANRQGKK